jgi:uncharacterized phiE125 gp8 family phage protein
MLTIITPPGAEPVTVAEALLQTRASSAEEAFLLLCIKGARAACEGIIGRALITRTVQQTFDTFDAAGLALQMRPVVALVSVAYDDADGAPQTLAGCQLDTVGDRALVLPPLGTEWPATQDGKAGAVRVQFTAGYGADASAVPADIRTWLLLTVGFLYTQREAFDMTGKAADIPSRFVDSLLDPFRSYGF